MKIYSWLSIFVTLIFASTPLLLSYTSLGVGIDHDLRVFLGTAFVLLGIVLQAFNSLSINQGWEIRRLAMELDTLKSKNNPAHVGAGVEVAGKVAVFKSLDGSVGGRYLSGHDSTQ